MAQIFRTDSHDVIVEKFADLIGKNNPEKYRISTSVSGEEGPDILLVDANTDEEILAVEVETVDSLTEERISSRWKDTAEKHQSFQAVIPKGTRARVNRICKRSGIKVRYHEY